MERIEKPELLLPAGSLQRLKTAALYGADAVYAGVPAVSLRAKTSISMEEMEEGICFLHSLNKKIYLTLNLFTHNRDIENLEKFVDRLKYLRPDGVIIADSGVFDYVGDCLPDLPRHVSTQANVCSWLTVKAWQKRGASLCVLGREVPLSEIREIRKKCPDIRLEMFIHGAMCMSYSGRCLISNFLTGRSANQGKCAHSCRWKYKMYLEEENRPGEFFELFQDDHGSYLMNSRDLCAMPVLKEVLESGVNSLKIEGRNKSEHYVAVTAHAYRHAIDSYYSRPESFNPKDFMAELETLQNRGYTTGFLLGNAGPESQNYDATASTGAWRAAGQISGYDKQGRMILTIRHKIKKGMELEFLSPFAFTPFKITVGDFYDESNGQPLEEISCGRPEQKILLSLKEVMKEMIDSSASLNAAPIEKLQKMLPPLCVCRTKEETTL
jgi:U32 family peptidase